ncbi:flagellar hook-basal body protein [Desulforamulus hydrothermalis]|uniref:Flagellar basal-body rod protein flgG n=1 Tax=Desulforamulus hydrothermalis Lam5 = DSM 18033 TaxID=1121428 RepID=K8EKX4_9FIRM|nr:flagellar hook-basal body protein [Desulforamulus hydrothermalis]CCO09186.1 Flagellar basal-body rod protein flgG [Desulforamulus hydrothermalis Lam5 = DSM 18033]SHH11062.1 flagellar basal-body rod protein FlgG [Desulforamulus hydrothermalis Lam5 = DSM 18033]
MIIKTLASGASGMRAHQLKLDTIGNNIANINTTGYKKSRVNFADMVQQALGDEGIPAAADPRPAGGSGVRTVTVARLFEQGDLLQTGRELDLAIEGEGFFKVMPADGEDDREYYTRDGSFYITTIDDEPVLVNAGGYKLDWDGQLDPETYSSYQVNEKGEVYGLKKDGTIDKDPIGTIQLYTFAAPANLMSKGNNLYLPTAASGEATAGTPGEEGVGYLRSGYLERSNVDLAVEMIGMIEAQRAYAANSRTVQTADEMWDRANNLRK